MTALIIADHDNVKLSKASQHVVVAALKLGSSVHILVAGKGCAGVAQTAAGISGVARVLLVDDAVYKNALAENIAPLVAGLAKDYSHILTAATSTGKDFMPRVAALLDVAQISDVISIVSEDTFRHPVYAGNAIETVQSKDKIKVLTIRQTGFDAAAVTGGSAEIIPIAATTDSGLSQFVSKQESKSERPELTSARVVISGGRGLGSKENFALVEKLATKLNAAVGASRAAVDAGYVPNDYQVGQTGKIVAPDLYIAIGISGAIQHLAGMKESKVIVAINKDENAPIFEIADYGLVGDLFTILPELESAL
jgi:electron transfer flavoprotein alpha subunit